MTSAAPNTLWGKSSVCGEPICQHFQQFIHPVYTLPAFSGGAISCEGSWNTTPAPPENQAKANTNKPV